MPRPLLTALLTVGFTLAACTRGTPIPEEVTLEPAPSTTTPPTTPPPGTPAPAPTAPEPGPDEAEVGTPVVLREDGLGNTLRFGVPADQILAGLTLRWGPPDEDSGWLESNPQFGGVCPGGNVRGVSWGRFSVLFTDGRSPYGPEGRKHFFSWTYAVINQSDPRPDPGGRRPALQTEAGISVGATVSDLRAAYGDGLNLYDDTTEEGMSTGGPGFGAAGLIGSLTSLEPDGRVGRIIGGGGCG